MNQEECICALATPAGGAIGIIRLSGHDAITITDKIFQSANGKSLEEAKRDWDKFNFGIFGCWTMDEDGNLDYIPEENYTEEMWNEQKKLGMRMMQR